MKFIELTDRFWNYDIKQYEIRNKFLLDFQSGWEIHDNGDNPATWVNNHLGQNKSVQETYAEIKHKLIRAGLLIGDDIV